MNWKQLPNIITSIRLLLLIPLSYFLANEDYKLALVIFFVAGTSDALDGFLAKKFNWVSRFGSILDPIADKALLVVTMAILTLNQKISLTLFIFVTVRDIYIVLGAFIFYKKIGPFDMQPSWLSKLNTFVQILLVTLILISLSYFKIEESLIYWLKNLVYLTVIASGVHYSWVWGRKFTDALKKKRES